MPYFMSYSKSNSLLVFSLVKTNYIFIFIKIRYCKSMFTTCILKKKLFVCTPYFIRKFCISIYFCFNFSWKQINKRKDINNRKPTVII
nr:MAG TPA: hypothetical protein [Caudoviricetes sp.]